MDTTMMQPADLATQIGKEVGVSSWHMLDQAKIDEFADCTEDRQWIHVDPARAAKESPFGGTIAHGFLTLALVAPTTFEVLMTKLTLKQAVNYGLEKVRFVCLWNGSGGDGPEGEEKPALVALSQAMLMS